MSLPRGIAIPKSARAATNMGYLGWLHIHIVKLQRSKVPALYGARARKTTKENIM
jgi:hypothetical protein